jgi:hypothetical protein
MGESVRVGVTSLYAVTPTIAEMKPPSHEICSLANGPDRTAWLRALAAHPIGTDNRTARIAAGSGGVYGRSADATVLASFQLPDKVDKSGPDSRMGLRLGQDCRPGRDRWRR